MLEHQRTRRFVFVTLLVSLGAVGATTARAADRGKNGKIAFFANLTGVAQIYTINPDGTDLFQVTYLPQASDPFLPYAPDFSPDGRADRLSSRYDRAHSNFTLSMRMEQG